MGKGPPQADRMVSAARSPSRVPILAPSPRSVEARDMNERVSPVRGDALAWVRTVPYGPVARKAVRRLARARVTGRTRHMTTAVEPSAAPAYPPIGVHSEVGKLRTVMIHRPDLELKRLTPENHDELLFDDVLWVRKATEQHDAFAGLLRDNGVEVLYLETLLAEA